jgi:hypothetical protein
MFEQKISVICLIVENLIIISGMSDTAGAGEELATLN